MSQIIVAPNEEQPIYTSVFLAGGISGCKDWQKKVIEELKYDDLSIFNPRREYFDITNKNASYQQIEWEFKRLERMDIFSMYFCNSNSDQPICMYELGRNILRMQNRFPSDWQKRIVVSIEKGYKRENDVIIQLSLCAPKICVYPDVDPETHAFFIRNLARRLSI